MKQLVGSTGTNSLCICFRHVVSLCGCFTSHVVVFCLSVISPTVFTFFTSHFGCFYALCGCFVSLFCPFAYLSGSFVHFFSRFSAFCGQEN